MSWDRYQNIVWIRPTDYSDYGGEVERWKDVRDRYPDCSCGCKWFKPIDQDGWGVCTNRNGPRYQLLTWEHQAGYQCFEPM